MLRDMMLTGFLLEFRPLIVLLTSYYVSNRRPMNAGYIFISDRDDFLGERIKGESEYSYDGANITKVTGE